MPDISFNTEAGKTIGRELLVCYLNTGTQAAPVWSPLGRRVDDSATELDWESETRRTTAESSWRALRSRKAKAPPESKIFFDAEGGGILISLFYP